MSARHPQGIAKRHYTITTMRIPLGPATPCMARRHPGRQRNHLAGTSTQHRPAARERPGRDQHRERVLIVARIGSRGSHPA